MELCFLVAISHQLCFFVGSRARVVGDAANYMSLLLRHRLEVRNRAPVTVLGTPTQSLQATVWHGNGQEMAQVRAGMIIETFQNIFL